jgi:hypothetical protein
MSLSTGAVFEWAKTADTRLMICRAMMAGCSLVVLCVVPIGRAGKQLAGNG